MRKVEIPLEKVVLFKYRKHGRFGETELIETISNKGLLLPVSVRQEGDIYNCFMGQGRVEAKRKLGHMTISAYVYDESEKTSKEMLLDYFIDNMCRPHISQIGKYEIAISLKKGGVKHNTIAKQFGVSPKTLYRGMRLFKKATEVLKNAHDNGVINETQMNELSKIKGERAHEAILQLLKEQPYSHKDKTAVIQLARDMDRSGEKITLPSLRRSISDVKGELFALKGRVDAKRNRYQTLLTYIMTLQQDKKFLALLKHEDLNISI